MKIETKYNVNDFLQSNKETVFKVEYINVFINGLSNKITYTYNQTKPRVSLFEEDIKCRLLPEND